MLDNFKSMETNIVHNPTPCSCTALKSISFYKLCDFECVFHASKEWGWRFMAKKRAKRKKKAIATFLKRSYSRIQKKKKKNQKGYSPILNAARVCPLQPFFIKVARVRLIATFLRMRPLSWPIATFARMRP